MNRRWILAGGMASTVLGATRLSAQPASPGPASDLKVSITLDGTTYSYPDGPKIPSYYVGFRQDGRIVFHLGALGNLSGASPQPKPYHLPAHHVRIERGGEVLLDSTIPRHWWNAQWTYRPKPLEVVKKPAQIVAERRMFAFGNTGAKVEKQPRRVPYTIMGSSDIVVGMPTTGERPDIGLVTDNSGYFMLGASPDPMIDWAQCAGSCPMHFRDEATGRPIDLMKYPAANAYDVPGLQGTPFLLKGPPNPRLPEYTSYGGSWTPQQAHYCEMSYVAYLATGDLGFLEDLQFSANFILLDDGALSKRFGKATPHGEYRGVAWAFRNLFMAHVATADAEAAGRLPASCHPSSYFKFLLDNALAYYRNAITNPARQTFRLVVEVDRMFAPWQVDYMLTALAFGVLTGHSDWTPLYLWALGNAIARTDAASGYPPGYGGAYYLDPAQPNWHAAFLAGVARFDGAEPPPPDRVAALNADPYNGGIPMRGLEYLMTTRAVLVMADYLDKNGLAAVRKTYPNFDLCLKTIDRMFLATGKVNPRVSVISA